MNYTPSLRNMKPALQLLNLYFFIDPLLELCTLEFDENIYVVDTRKRAAQESSNILQEEDDENISLEEEECEEEIEMDMFQPNLGEELDLPTSPSTFDSSTQTQKSFCYL